MNTEKKQITVTLPALLLNQISYFVDGVNFRNRSHIIHQAIAEWIDRESKKRKGQLTIDDATRGKTARPLKAPAKARRDR